MKTALRMALALFFCVVLCFCLVPAAFAETIASGTCGAHGDNLNWTLDGSGKLTISGEGAMNNFPWDSESAWRAYTGNIKEVEIKSGVTTIGERAFFGCSGLTDVTIPDGVTTIGDYAFRVCSGLTSVTIPDSVTSIGNGAFFGCSSLTDVTIPVSVTTIGFGAFYRCSSLTSVIIPDSVTSIGEGAFYECGGLTSVIIPDSVTSIGNSAFWGCSSLTSVTISDSMTAISPYTFNGCSSLTSVTIPNSVTSIGEGAFAGCSGLADVWYGGTEAQWDAISIGDNNTHLTEAMIHCEDSSAYNDGNYGGHHYALYKGNTTWSAARDYCQALGGHLATITSAEEQAFIDSLNTDNIRMWIGGYRDDQHNWYWVTGEPWSYTNWGDGEPNNSGNVVSNENCVAVWPSFWNDMNDHNTYETEGFICEWDRSDYIVIPDPDFILPAALTTIENEAFVGGAFAYVKLPDNAVSISSRAFADCPNLAYIYIPEATKSISTTAFDGVTGLTILGLAGSFAETYSQTCGFTFIAVA